MQPRREACALYDGGDSGSIGHKPPPVRSLTTEYFVQESLVACGVGSEHRRRISWIAERPYEIALFEIKRRNLAPNGAGQFDNPPPPGRNLPQTAAGR